MAQFNLSFDAQIAHMVVDGPILPDDAEFLFALQESVFERFSDAGRWVSLIELVNVTSVHDHAIDRWRIYLGQFRLKVNAPYVTAFVIDPNADGAAALASLVSGGYQDAGLPVRTFNSVHEARWWLGGAFP